MLCLWHRGCLGLLLKLDGALGLNLGPRATRHTCLGMLRCVLCHLVLRRRMRHHHVGLGGHGLLRVMRMLCVRRRRRMRRHGLVVRLRLVVHGLLQVLRRWLAVYAPVLVMLRGRRDRGR